jgi:hypothetical protein
MYWQRHAQNLLSPFLLAWVAVRSFVLTLHQCWPQELQPFQRYLVRLAEGDSSPVQQPSLLPPLRPQSPERQREVSASAQVICQLCSMLPVRSALLLPLSPCCCRWKT